MNSEVKRIEKGTNLVLAKPAAWAVYGLLVGARYGYRGLARLGTWLQRRYAAANAR
jgi:hypothetical protein